MRRAGTHAVLLAVGIGVIAAEVAKHALGLGEAAVIVAGIVTAVAAMVVLRWPPARLWCRFLAVAPVLFAAVLLVASPATTVVFGSEPAAAKVVVSTPHRVVVIVMDEFPLVSLLDGAGAIDPELFPNLAALSTAAPGTATTRRSRPTRRRRFPRSSPAGSRPRGRRFPWSRSILTTCSRCSVVGTR